MILRITEEPRPFVRDSFCTIMDMRDIVYVHSQSIYPRVYDLGDGKGRHSRTLGHSLGTHSLRYFEDHGVEVKLVPQAAKHRYINFLDPDWRHRLKPEVLAYPKQIKESEPC